ncbi:hypothetical protein PENSPDRAFT_654118 [Peniophora sp. CONT]|nr:hypothetical protein PENSPDRAFT_654118 [Peniophora sp. CONT]
MTAPVPDAFSAMNHDAPVRRSSRSSSRSLTRSPSPKISFATPAHVHPVPTRPTIRQRKSKTTAATEPTVAEVSDEADDASSSSTLVGNGHVGEKAEAKPIDWEIPRKILHSSIGFFTLYLYASNGSPQHVVYALAGALCVIVPADILRLNFPAFERLYETLLGFLMRDSEKTRSNGVIWYMIGVIWVLSLYPLDIATVAILLLSWADTAASTFGRLWGRYTPPLPRTLLGLPLAPRKSFAGFAAAAITGAAITAGFWAVLAPMYDSIAACWSVEEGVRAFGVDHSQLGDAARTFLREQGFKGVHTGGWVGLAIISVIAGLCTAVAEALDLGNLDDNLTLPIISGACIWGTMKVISWLSI